MGESGKLRVGVVGAGVMGECHARVYSELRDTRLIGVYDVDTGRAIEIVRKYGGNVFSSLHDLYRSVDAVTIASPTTEHAPAALQAINHGLHILIENPLAATLEDAQAIVDCANRHRNQIVMVGHIERFNPTVAALKVQLTDLPIVSITMRRMRLFGDRALDTDVVHELMTHDIDLALNLLGDAVETIDAIGSPVRTSLVDQAMAQLTMRDGAEVHLIASRVANRTVRSIEVRTPVSRIVADLFHMTLDVREESGCRDAGGHRVHQVNVPSADPLQVELQHFVDCICERAELSSGVAAGYQALAYANSINALIGRTASVVSTTPAMLQFGH